MKTLKLKSILFGLMAFFAIAIVMTSCEQEAINNLQEDSQLNIETGKSCSDCMMYSHEEPDEIIDVLIKYSENGEPVFEKAARYGEVVVYGGDVVITENYSTEISLRGNIISDFSRVWPNSTMPYVWGDGLPEFRRDQILDAIENVNNQTNLCLVERTDETAFVQFRGTDDGCYVTRIGNDGTTNQIINLGSGCFSNHTVIHEILHKAGFYHEQTRPDRDDFISVNWDNLDGNRWRAQFQRQGGETNSGAYDFASIMHYVQFHSSVTIDDTQPLYFINDLNDLPTGMTANDIGTLQNMSATDIASVNTLYPTACGGGAANSLSWNPTPTSISNGNNQVTLDYSINQNGVLFVQVFNQSSELIGQVFEDIPSGTRQSTLTLPAENPSATDNHLIAKLLDSNWGDIGVEQLDEKLPLGGTPPSSNSLSWNPTPTSISNGNNQVTLDYSINQNGVLFVQVFNQSWELIGQVFEDVPSGTRQSTLTLPAENPSATGNHLQAKLLDTNWGDIGVEQLYEKLPSGGTPPPPSGNSLSWNPTPTSISNGNNQVTLDYSINQNGVLLVQVFNPSWELIGQVYEDVSSGARQSTLTLPAENPSATNNHLTAKLLNTSWGDIGVEQLYEKVPSGGTPPPPPPGSNSLSWNPTPTNISNGSNQVTLDYSIDQNGIILVQVFNSSWELVGQAYKQASPGARQSTLNLNASGLSSSNNHLQAKLLNYDWGDVGVQQLYVHLP